MIGRAGLPTRDQVVEINARFADAGPEDVLAWALDCFHPRVALASSFGAEDVVLIDMLHGINPSARVVTLDTLRLHTATGDADLLRRAQRCGARSARASPT